MMMKRGDLWSCTNPACCCEVLVKSSGKIEGRSPTCSCGAQMKKKNVAPVHAYLEFLGDQHAFPAANKPHGE